MAKIKPARKKGTMPKSLYKKGGSTSMKSVKAPSGFHWMKSGSSFRLMKNPPGGFKKHPGASLSAKFKVQKVHKK